MTTTDIDQSQRGPALALVVDNPPPDRCEVCGTSGPVAPQQVGDNPDVVFQLCARCGYPAVDAGIGWWLPVVGPDGRVLACGPADTDGYSDDREREHAVPNDGRDGA